MYVVVEVLFAVGVLSFSLNKMHLLTSLISLEYMVLVLFATMSLINTGAGVAGLSLAFLTISVCEGALGLGVLVMFARAFGGESLDMLAAGLW
uniref:NADH-ubiquinone oxidoreductase chain 4L n=1 Tax=Proasellus cavaticus TaxID=1281949 RepID=A0A485MAK7_9CRUS|nr:NADH dehydrogenase subunit 4l [Proasellus cavaticus]